MWLASREDPMQPYAPPGGHSHVRVGARPATRVSDWELDGEATEINMRIVANATARARVVRSLG
jgi:hypothetical protein